MTAHIDNLRPRAHRDGHDTELEAQASMVDPAKTVRARVLALLKGAGSSGLTDDEGARLYAQRYPSAHTDRLTFGRRRHELAVAGYAHDSGARRKTPRGRRAIVWVVPGAADLLTSTAAYEPVTLSVARDVVG